jgi:hypothetical protein
MRGQQNIKCNKVGSFTFYPRNSFTFYPRNSLSVHRVNVSHSPDRRPSPSHTHTHEGAANPNNNRNLSDERRFLCDTKKHGFLQAIKPHCAVNQHAFRDSTVTHNPTMRLLFRIKLLSFFLGSFFLSFFLSLSLSFYLTSS